LGATAALEIGCGLSDVVHMGITDALQALRNNDWNSAHQIVQNLDGETAAWLHGVLHMIEGDESNARYWYRQAGRAYPGRARIEAEIEAIRSSLAA
jgi:hypothetical protein